ncbi:unnamed protein product [Lactuca virosa]|uniref:Uncharacterized protein n=1 Tax=Lactuca virosa TaxID=75947 RepID=A0AAU9PFM9_9ASTR|nr:unnamed protein product [Lactuca virosa]
MDKREATIKQVQTELTTTTHNRNNDMFTRWMKRVMLQKKEKVKRNGNGIGHKEKDLYIAYLSRFVMHHQVQEIGNMCYGDTTRVNAKLDFQDLQ